MKKILVFVAFISVCLFGSGQVSYGNYSVQSQETKKGKSYSLLNEKGKTIIKSSRTISYFENSRFCVFDDKTSKYGVFDCTLKKGKGDYLIPPKFDNIEYMRDLRCIKITSNNKVGLIKLEDGSVISEPLYDDIEIIKGDGLLKIKINNKFGLIKLEDGLVISKPIYDDIEIIKGDGLLKIKINNKFGLIRSNDGSILIEPIYDAIYYSDEFESIKLEHDSRIGLADRIGRIILPVEFTKIELYEKGLLRVYWGPLDDTSISRKGMYKKNNDGLWEKLIDYKYFYVERLLKEEGHFIACNDVLEKQLINPIGQVCHVILDGESISAFEDIKSLTVIRGLELNESIAANSNDEIATYYYWVEYKGHYGIIKDVWDFTKGVSLIGSDGCVTLVEPFDYIYNYRSFTLNLSGTNSEIFQFKKGNEILLVGPSRYFGKLQNHLSYITNKGEEFLLLPSEKALLLINENNNEIIEWVNVKEIDSEITLSTNLTKEPNISSLSYNGKPLSFSDSFFKTHPNITQYPTRFYFEQDEIEIKETDSKIYTYACPFKTDDISFYVKSNNYSRELYAYQSLNGDSYLKNSCNSFYYDNNYYDISRISPSFKNAESFIPISYFRKDDGLILLHIEKYRGEPINVVYTEPRYTYVGGRLYELNSGVHYDYSEPQISYLTRIDKETVKPTKRITLKGFDYPYMYKAGGYKADYGYIRADKIDPIYLLTEDLDVNYMIYPNEDDVIYDFCLTEGGIIMVGDNKQKGYVGYHNPVIYYYSFKSNTLISIPDKRQQKNSFIVYINKVDGKNQFELTYLDDNKGSKTTEQIIEINYEDYEK